MKLSLPPLLAIDEQENGNTIQQWLLSPTSIEATVAAATKGKTPHYSASPQDGSPSILLQTKSTTPRGDWTHVIRVRGTDVVPSAAALDLRVSKWLRHPQAMAPFTDVTGFEGNAT